MEAHKQQLQRQQQQREQQQRAEQKREEQQRREQQQREQLELEQQQREQQQLQQQQVVSVHSPVHFGNKSLHAQRWHLLISHTRKLPNMPSATDPGHKLFYCSQTHTALQVHSACLIACGEDRLVQGVGCCTTSFLSCCLTAFRSSDLQAQQQQAQAHSSQLQQPTQSTQIKQSGPQAPQLAQPPQNGSATAAVADGGGNADPSRLLRIADSAAHHEAHYRAKLHEAQVTVVCCAVRVPYTPPVQSATQHTPGLYSECVPVLLLQWLPEFIYHTMKAVRLRLYWPY